MKIYIITEVDESGAEQLQTVRNPWGGFSNVFVNKHDAQWAWGCFCATKPYKEEVRTCLHELDTAV